MNGKGRSGSDMRLKRVLYDEGDAPAFCAGPPCRAGKGEDRVPRRSKVGDLGLVTGRAQSGLRQQHDVDVVLNEGGYVGLLLEVLTDLALKRQTRQTRSVFSAEEELRGM